MAIAFDASASLEPVVVISPYNTTFTCSGSDRIVFAVLATSAATTGVSMTYDGAAMTLLTSTQVGTAFLEHVYYKIAPSTTAGATVSVTFTGQLIDVALASYTGADQTTPIQDATGHVQKGTQASGTTISSQTDSSQTTSKDNTWHVGGGGTEVASVTAGAGTTNRAQTAGFVICIADNNAAVTPAGTNTINWTVSSGRAFWTSWTLAPVSTGGATATYTPQLLTLRVG